MSIKKKVGFSLLLIVITLISFSFVHFINSHTPFEENIPKFDLNNLKSSALTVDDIPGPLATGESHDIEWTDSGNVTNVKIELYLGGVWNQEIIAQNM